MENPFKIDPFAMEYEAYERLYSKECTVNWYSDDIEQEIDGRECNVFGFTYFPEEGKPEIYINVNASVRIALETLAHEFAHVAVGADEDHGPEWKEAFENIHKEYKKIGAELFGY